MSLSRTLLTVRILALVISRETKTSPQLPLMGSMTNGFSSLAQQYESEVAAQRIGMQIIIESSKLMNASYRVVATMPKNISLGR